MADDRKPGYRVIAKLTDARTDRFHNIGVAWAKRTDRGTLLTIRLSPFCDGAALVKAEALMVVPYNDNAKPENAQPAPRDNGNADDDIPVEDDDIPF